MIKVATIILAMAASSVAAQESIFNAVRDSYVLGFASARCNVPLTSDGIRVMVYGKLLSMDFAPDEVAEVQSFSYSIVYSFPCETVINAVETSLNKDLFQ